mgnify:CR=1 FL=1
MKNHLSHDILLLCSICHEKAVEKGNILKKSLSMLCDAPLHNNDCLSRKLQVKIRSCARTLLSNGN